MGRFRFIEGLLEFSRAEAHTLLCDTLLSKVFDEAWTQEMDSVLIKMIREDKATWPAPQKVLRMDYSSCYIHFHLITARTLPVSIKLGSAKLHHSLQELLLGGHGSLSEI